MPVPAGPGPGAAPGPAGAAEVTDTIRVPDAAARPRQSGRQRSSSRALHSLRRPRPLGLRPPAACSWRPLLPASGRRCCGGPGTGTVVLRALPGCEAGPARILQQKDRFSLISHVLLISHIDNNFKFGDPSQRITMFGDPSHQNEHLTIFLSIQKQKLDVLEMFSIFSIFSLLSVGNFTPKMAPGIH